MELRRGDSVTTVEGMGRVEGGRRKGWEWRWWLIEGWWKKRWNERKEEIEVVKKKGLGGREGMKAKGREDEEREEMDTESREHLKTTK